MNIEFVPASQMAEFVVPEPKPAKTYIPEWYKDIKVSKDMKIGPTGELNFDGRIKKCVPFLDGLTSGYIQESWTDIFIENTDNAIRFGNSTGPEIVQIRESVSPTISDVYYPIEFLWQIQWFPKLPKGWSAIITHPLNRIDLPFSSLSGIFDSDVFYHGGPGNYPFYIHKGFSGLIPAGTPMYQIIPFKREKWKSSKTAFKVDDFRKREHKIRKHMLDAYRKEFWQKKTYD
ncbi:hypothetical protein EB001_08295 [bacterium]|nr:hypothetical protein [bacterium]